MKIEDLLLIFIGIGLILFLILAFQQIQERRRRWEKIHSDFEARAESVRQEIEATKRHMTPLK